MLNKIALLGFEPALGARYNNTDMIYSKRQYFFKLTLMGSGYLNKNISIESSYVH